MTSPQGNVDLDPYKHPVLSPVVGVIMKMLFVGLRYEDYLVGMQEQVLSAGHQGRTPLLMVFSTRDELVPAEDMEDFVRRWQQRNGEAATHVVRFSDTHHVMHAMERPHEYTSAVLQFWATLVHQTQTMMQKESLSQ